MLIIRTAALVLLALQAKHVGAEDPTPPPDLPGIPDPWRSITVKNNCPYTIWYVRASCALAFGSRIDVVIPLHRPAVSKPI
jgi:hypothetical protein